MEVKFLENGNLPVETTTENDLAKETPVSLKLRWALASEAVKVCKRELNVLYAVPKADRTAKQVERIATIEKSVSIYRGQVRQINQAIAAKRTVNGEPPVRIMANVGVMGGKGSL